MVGEDQSTRGALKGIHDLAFSDVPCHDAIQRRRGGDKDSHQMDTREKKKDEKEREEGEEEGEEEEGQRGKGKGERPGIRPARGRNGLES